MSSHKLKHRAMHALFATRVSFRLVLATLSHDHGSPPFYAIMKLCDPGMLVMRHCVATWSPHNTTSTTKQQQSGRLLSWLNSKVIMIGPVATSHFYLFPRQGLQLQNGSDGMLSHFDLVALLLLRSFNAAKVACDAKTL